MINFNADCVGVNSYCIIFAPVVMTHNSKQDGPTA